MQFSWLCLHLGPSGGRTERVKSNGESFHCLVPQELWYKAKESLSSRVLGFCLSAFVVTATRGFSGGDDLMVFWILVTFPKFLLTAYFSKFLASCSMHSVHGLQWLPAGKTRQSMVTLLSPELEPHTTFYFRQVFISLASWTVRSEKSQLKLLLLFSFSSYGQILSSSFTHFISQFCLYCT